MDEIRKPTMLPIKTVNVMGASKINTHDNRSLRERFNEYLDEIEQKAGIADIQVMVYAKLKQVTNGSQVHISEVFGDIKTKSERQGIKKEELSVACFSASMINGKRTDTNVTQHSGLIIIDIDVDKNPDIDFTKLKKDLKKDKYTYACFNSPSGGIKMVVKTNIESKSDHKAFFNSIMEYMQTNHDITEIDTSGSNISRTCFLPYDKDIFINTHASKYRLEKNQLDNISTTLNISKSLNNTSKQLLQVDSISYEQHYENILNLLKKRTEIGLYANIFNEYRYHNIERGIMDTSVPFLELIILKNIYPYKLDWDTKLDEYFFKDHPQKQLNVLSIGCNDGIEICKIGFKKDYIIKEHYRAKTLGSFSMKLIFNNPFCHPDYLIREVQRINNYFCEDPNPEYNPKPTDEDVRNIVLLNYTRFLVGELDFSTVIRMKPKKNEASHKYVFKSKQFSSIDRSITHLEAVRTFHEGKNVVNQKRFEEAIYVLQDGNKITQKRIAKYLGLSTKTIRRYMNVKYEELFKRYNATVRSMKKHKSKV